MIECRTVNEFWTYIKSLDNEFSNGKYKGRRKYLIDEFHNIFMELENPKNQNINLLKPLTEKIDSDYLRRETDLMLAAQKENPTEAIGKGKELVETICKTILEERKESYSKTDDINVLMDKVVKLLHLSPKNISDEVPLSKTLKQILGSLRAISSGLAELRNPHGSGHGKAASYNGLEERHAKLAVGSSSTLVNFLWDCHVMQTGGK